MQLSTPLNLNAMLLFTLLLPVALVISYLVTFPKTKGVLRPIKVKAEQRRF